MRPEGALLGAVPAPGLERVRTSPAWRAVARPSSSSRSSAKSRAFRGGTARTPVGGEPRRRTCRQRPERRLHPVIRSAAASSCQPRNKLQSHAAPRGAPAGRRAARRGSRSASRPAARARLGEVEREEHAGARTAHGCSCAPRGSTLGAGADAPLPRGARRPIGRAGEARTAPAAAGASPPSWSGRGCRRGRPAGEPSGVIPRPSASFTLQHTVPTGFSSVPLGPAMPVIATAVSASKRRRAPSAIASATGSRPRRAARSAPGPPRAARPSPRLHKPRPRPSHTPRTRAYRSGGPPAAPAVTGLGGRDPPAR